MGLLDDKKILLQQIRANEADGFEMNDQSILSEYERKLENNRGMAIKVLSIFGGILSSFAFLGFLFILGIYDSSSGMLVLGLGLVASAILLSNRFDKLIIDALSVCMYVVGFILLMVAFISLDFHEDAILMLSIILSLITLFFGKNYLLSFISVVAVGLSLLLLIISNDAHEAVHFYIVLYAVGITYFLLEEASLLTGASLVARLYEPVRIGLVVSLLMGILMLGRDRLIPSSNNFIWISSAAIIVCVLFTIRTILVDLQIGPKNKTYVIYVLSLLSLLPTVLAPAISGSLLIVLLSYKVNYKTGFVIGLVALVYSIGQYYYDLKFTLLTKSILLMVSGTLFLFFYFYLKKQRSDEKV